MEELLKHLTEVSIRQQQIVEHMAARQGEVEREVAAFRTASAQRVPLLDPRVRATTLLPKMTVHDDVESFLLMFESIASQEGWPRDEWARVLAPLLTGEPQRAYFAMPPELTGSYEDLKKEILSRVGLSPVAAAQLVHEWEYSSRLPARAQAADLSRLTRHWLLAGDPSAAQVADRVVVDRLLRALPRPIRQAAGMRNPLTVGELVEAIELAEAAQRREAGERMPIPRRVPQERRSPEGTFRPVGRPAAPVPQDEPMPTEPPTAPRRAWLAGLYTTSRAPPGSPEGRRGGQRASLSGPPGLRQRGQPGPVDCGFPAARIQGRLSRSPASTATRARSPRAASLFQSRPRLLAHRSGPNEGPPRPGTSGERLARL